MPILYKTDIASDADLKVFVTDIRSDADLVMYETTSNWEATVGHIWCYTDIRSEAAKVVYFTDSQWDADIKVFKTDIQSDAEWLNSDKQSLL